MTGKDMGRASAIARLNDQLRRTLEGGQVTITKGIAALPREQFNAIMAAVRSFEAFSPDNDPWGEHDCAALTVSGIRVICKVDYYDPSISLASSNPADSSVTIRILTVMLEEEY